MDIYEFSDYRNFLKAHMRKLPMQGHGVKASMAQLLGCQSTYISRVFTGKANFSLEQAEKLTDFLGLAEGEAHYFLLLVQKQRAGTARLEKYFEKQIEAARKQRLNLKDRLKVKKSLSIEDQAKYYSSWEYSAIHVMVSISRFRSKSDLAQALRLPLKKISSVIDFLVSVELLLPTKDWYKLGEATLHLAADSPMISKHHTNWRIQVIKSLEKNSLEDIHYSSVITLSQEDAFRIKEHLIQFISRCKKIVRTSKEEEVYGFCCDFFNLLE